ncbi:FtsB family cell division protein [Kurthia sibirica]|uniref:Cell division protein DIVIC n=1 Tax=Kurthia sibirica TaxID=202750 RepID=A0A2U3AIB6_9BACL|nr:septum formation initiator family protein [Kurthia sibirica]PWI24270.1 hypothetical protein DEX24_14240 [Kurthia sibirica]GEK34496.1 cell division protein DIVIC [Kurthia sibirica]
MSEKKSRRPNSISRIHQDFVKQEEIKAKRLHNRKVSLYRNLAIMTTIFFLTVGSLLFTLAHQKNNLQEKKEAEIALKRELDNQKEQQKELKTQIVKLDDDDYIAKIVRKDLFLSKKGEKIFNIPNAAKDDDEMDFSQSQKD